MLQGKEFCNRSCYPTKYVMYIYCHLCMSGVMTTSTFKSVFKKLIGRNQKHKNWIPAEIQKIQISNSYVYRAVLSAVLYCTVLYCTGRLCFPAGSKPICSKRIICRDHNILAPIPKADHEALLPLKKIIETILWSRQINSTERSKKRF